jgi:Tol biopolymer transport system component
MSPASAAPARSDLILFSRSHKGTGQDIWTIRSDGRHLSRLTKGEGEEIGPVFSPDGRFIAFVRQHGQGESSTLWVMRANGTEKRRVAGNASTAGQLDWSPSGDEIVYVGSVADTAARDLFVVEVADETTSQLTSTPTMSESDPDWSPDGGHIAYAAQELRSRSDVWVVEAVGGEPRQLTTDASNDDLPLWSPDSTLIAFRSARDAPCQSCEDDLGSNPYAINPDGTGERRLAQVDASQVEEMAWSEGRLYLALGYDDESNAGANSDSELYSVRADGTGLRNVTDNRRHDLGLTVSPDGDDIYFVRIGSGRYRITRLALGTTRSHVLTTSHFPPDLAGAAFR